ncbi:zinc finger domain-containing protein [Streptomyces sp. NBC_01450]|uniref:zinc finger domain-containing protein n=1 Tax=Streptomyces sp. NBC_01450 TaxID=2903871 RepID=UPI003FCDCC6F
MQRKCPTCNARPGQECFDAVPDGQPLRRMGGHDERLQLVIASREKAAADKRVQRGGTNASRSSGTTTEDLAWSVSHVSCPTCKAPAGKPCSVPGMFEVYWREVVESAVARAGVVVGEPLEDLQPRPMHP